METLNNKIFDALTEKITVPEFENWLYNNDEFISNLNVNSFYFDLISIDYSNTHWKRKLYNLTEEIFNEEVRSLLNIVMVCRELISSNNNERSYQILSEIIVDFDYDTEFEILWTFYSLIDYCGSFEATEYFKDEFLIETKFYAKQILDLLSTSDGINEFKLALKQKLKPFINKPNVSIPINKKNNSCFFQKKLILRIKDFIFK